MELVGLMVSVVLVRKCVLKGQKGCESKQPILPMEWIVLIFYE